MEAIPHMPPICDEQTGTTPVRPPALIRARGTLPYGYHNTFHSHAQDALPPTYNEAKIAPLCREEILSEGSDVALPAYSCSVYKAGVVGLQIEFRDPFQEEAQDTLWQNVYAVLRGTLLSFHCIKTSFRSKSGTPQAGKKVAQFSLQHAEVGLAVDIKASDNIPKNVFLNFLSSTMREKIRQSKPHLFEPPKEFLLRLRLESFQILLCFDTEAVMLDWCERICEAIDISPPIEDRTDPRYRSLPRRSRRQRQLENPFLQRDENTELNIENLSNRLRDQQERIIRELYPNLALSSSPNQRQATTDAQQPSVPELERVTSGDADMDEFDAADVTEAPAGRTEQFCSIANRLSTTSSDSYSPKTARRGSRPSTESALRYRRRCMPIMYKHSPRATDIIFHKGIRCRIDRRKNVLKPFELSPPRYPRASTRNNRISGATTDSGSSASETASEDATSRATIRAVVSSEDEEEIGAVTPFLTTSRFSGRGGDELDRVSINSIGGVGATMEPVSTRASLGVVVTRDEIVETAPTSAGIMAPFKEKAVPLFQPRITRRSEDDVMQAFAGLIL